FYSGRAEPETCGWDPNVSRTGASIGGMTYPEQLEDLVEWRDLHKPKAEIWLTETGNDVGGPIGRSERHQAAKIPRGIMLALAAGIERVFIYREKGSDPSMHAGAGLLRNDNSVRPSWITMATMIRQLQGFEGRAVRLPSTDPNVWMLLWEDGKRRVVTAWTLEGTTKLGVELGKAEVCDAFGRKTQAKTTAEVVLGYAPTYLTVEPSAELARLVGLGRDRAKARAAERQRLTALPMSLYDFGGTDYVGMLKGYGLPRRFTAVGKDDVWNEERGYGFSEPAAGVDDMHWVGDPLERDSCRVSPSTTFRMRLPPGQVKVRVSAGAINGEPTEVMIGSGADQQFKPTTKESHLVEFTITVGAKPVEVWIKDWGSFKWLTAMPVAPAP
ncbi:MAG: hypothetical protein H0W72_10100, partial [Planctomycetes bacterium]|nr:hypothetical protein [Planctomycetota bacterium]